MIDDVSWEEINKLIEKGCIEKRENDDVFQLKYVDKHRDMLDIMLGFHVNSTDEKKGLLFCCSEWTCDGDIFKQGTNKLIIKNLTKPKDYGTPAINELYNFIKTHPFSASLEIEGKHIMLYKHKKLSILIGDKLQGVNFRQHLRIKLGYFNPNYAFHFISTEDGRVSYAIGITNRETEMEIPEHRFHYIIDEAIDSSATPKETEDDYTMFKRPASYSFRTFQDACDWVKENKKTLILNYDVPGGFKLKLSHEGIKIQETQDSEYQDEHTPDAA